MPSGAADPRRAHIVVMAGVNGAGKSTIAGAFIRERGADFYNPDEVARRIRDTTPHLSTEQANSAAWTEGRRLLEQAIASGGDFTFETTLGGHTIAAILEDAAAAGAEVRMWYVGLTSADLHIARVSARVRRGGHDISESKIRERYDRSRENLIRLLPKLAELKLYDNSGEGDPAAGTLPSPTLVLHVSGRSIIWMCAPADVPEWAKPIVAAALRLSR